VSSNPQELRREQAIFAGLATTYAVALGVFFALGNFGFVRNTLVIPSFFIVAALAGRFRAFVRDWSVFLGCILLFDSCRGLIYVAIRRLELPVYMGYVIDAERAVFGGLPTLSLQRHLFADSQIGAMERALVAVHASHFVFFLGFGMLVWLFRPQWFPRLTLSFILVMGVGITAYLLVPTVPPWMASAQFQMLPEITHISSQIYNVSLPTISRTFDTNPIAAMPSLHAAFPTLMTLLCFRLFGKWGLLMLGYFATVVFAIVYLGEHYVVDVLAGVVLALVGYLVAFEWQRVKSRLDQAGQIAAGPVAPGALVRPLVLTAILLTLAVGLGGVAAGRTTGGFLPDQGFIARELDGKSPVADYFRAVLAHSERDFRTAQPLLARAIPDIRDSTMRRRAQIQLAESAFHNGDFAASVRVLEELGRLSPRLVEMQAQAKAGLARPAVAR